MAADVCKALDLDKVWNAIQWLDEDEKGISSIDTLGGEQKLGIVNEPGLYGLVLRSRKPEAKAFKRWITHEVIPSIRKHGAYLTDAATDAFFSDPDTLAKLAIKWRDERHTHLWVRFTIPLQCLYWSWCQLN